jgi:transcriptional regulator with XRE-family HTH domain
MSVALSERLRRLRKERRLSQEAVARRADIGLRAYGELERGIATDPHLTTLEGIANAFGMAVTELVGEEEPVVPLAG